MRNEEIKSDGVMMRIIEEGVEWCDGGCAGCDGCDEIARIVDWARGQRVENERAARERRTPRNYHGPDGRTSCGGGCCEAVRGSVVPW